MSQPMPGFAWVAKLTRMVKMSRALATETSTEEGSKFGGSSYAVAVQARVAFGEGARTCNDLGPTSPIG